MSSLVSVIIPAYNIEKLIRQSVDSVLSQTYDDFELVVVDDGSTDNTGQILRSIKDPRMTYHYQPNSGLPSKPRNAGVRLSKGEYVAFLDHDDLWLPTKLERQMAIIDRDDQIGLISSNAFIMNDDQKTVIPLISGLKEGYLKDETFFPANQIIQSTALVKKSDFEAVGGLNESPDLKAIEDYDLWLRLYAKYPCYYIDECLAYYRKLRVSTSGGEMRTIEREVAHYRKYYQGYGFPEKINRLRLVNILFKKAFLQLMNGKIGFIRTTVEAMAAAGSLPVLIKYFRSIPIGKIFNKVRGQFSGSSQRALGHGAS
jgi:glycosyltransferase involved in cell wall biosynthesis